MAAGLQLKNQLTSKDATVRLQYQQRWMTLDDKIKSHVKTMVRNLIELKCISFYQVLFLGSHLIFIKLNFYFPFLFYRRFKLWERRMRDLLSLHRQVFHHCCFLKIQKCFNEICTFLFRKTSSSFHLDANDTTQALRGKDWEVNLKNFSLFIVCLLLANFTPRHEFNWQCICYPSVYISWNTRALYLPRQIPLLCSF